MNKDINLLFGKVMHKRLFPKVNHFTYGIFYFAFPLSRLQELPIALNRFSPLSFYESDHGACDGTNLTKWLEKMLKKHKIKIDIGEVILIAMPRVFGYVFNPISFWLIYDKQKKHKKKLRAVLCEVRNTFKERHIYVCIKKNQKEILATDIIKAKKLFHVSPFLKRDGYYEFNFKKTKTKFKTKIIYFNKNGKKQLITSLKGNLETANKKTIKKAFWFYPLITFKAIFLIHWQALKLAIKGIKHIKKPTQLEKKSSLSNNKAAFFKDNK